MSKLSLVEIGDLKKCESVIEKGKQHFVDVAVALTKIRERKLYRAAFETFEQYCQERWGFGRSYANMLIQAGVAVQSLPKNLASTLATPRAAIALAKVPAEQREHVVTEIKKDDKPVTSNAITTEAKRIESAKPVTLLDDMGFAIPEAAKKTWERRREVQDMLTSLTKLKSTLAAAHDDKDVLFGLININAAMSYLDQLFGEIKRAKPYAVCSACQGKLPEKCRTCKGSGIIGKFDWDKTDDKIKKVRMSQITRFA